MPRLYSTLLWVGQTLLIGVAGALLGTVLFGYGAATGGPVLATSLRTIGAIAVLALVLSLSRRWWRRTSALFHLSSAAVAYLLMPLSWAGHTLFGSLVLPPGGLPSALLDLVVWIAVAAGLYSLQARHHPPTGADFADRMDWVR